MTLSNDQLNWKNFDIYDERMLNEVLLCEKDLEQVGGKDEHSYFFPTLKNSTEEHVSIADQMIKGNIKLSPNHEEVNMSVPMDWNADPLKSNNWKFIFHSLKWLEFSMNAYLFTNDEAYILYVNSVIEDWMDNNQVENTNDTMAWKDHSTSIRLRLFAYYWSIYKTTKAFNENPDFNKKFVLSIYQHMLFHEDIDNYNLKSNHSLEMIGSILTASHKYKHDFERTDEMFDMGYELLEKYLNLNFSDKGYHFEQSPGYHWYVLKRFYFIYNYFKHYDIKLDFLENKMDLMLKANYMLLKPNYTFPTIGDTGYLNMKAQLKGVNERTDDNYFEELPNFDICKEAGYAIFRSNDRLSVFKCNNFVGTHGHNDHLGFTLYAKETEWFVDPGYYTYNTNDPFRRYFIDASAHNTVIIDGKSGDRGDEKTEITFNEYTQKVTAGRFFEKGTHNRTFQKLENDDHFIEDEILGDGSAALDIEQLYHIHPRLSIRKITDHVIELENDKGVICQLSQLNKIGNWHTVKGQETPHIQGWFSEKFNQIEPTFTLKYVVNNKHNVNLKTHIQFM